MKNWLIEHKKEALLGCGIFILAFLIGLALPSLFIRKETKPEVVIKLEPFFDTTNMLIDGGLYSGTICRSTLQRDGFGRYQTKDGSVYEGNWKEDKLKYGTRTTPASVYKGRFDAELNNHGFGIVNYSEAYISGKASQGLSDSEIIVTYIGNWNKNYKQGLGRSIKKDGTMEFGVYSEGKLQTDNTKEAYYRIGGSVYGIDVSHFQPFIDWDNLALYCDRNGIVYREKPKGMAYLQPVFFAYIKATDGATYKDETYDIRTIEAERHGIAKGAYHFLRLGSPVDDQLKNFFETVTWKPGDLPPALDVEGEKEVAEYGIDSLRSMTLEWLEKAEMKLGIRPIIYTNQDFRERYLNGPQFNKYKFWVAKCGEKLDSSDWQIWQQSHNGQIRGCEGCVDIDVFCGDYDAFTLYLQSFVAEKQ